MRWYFLAAFALFAVATSVCQGIDSKSPKAPDIKKGDAATEEKKKTVAKEAHLDRVKKKASIDDQQLLTQDNEHLAMASKQTEALDAVNGNSETLEREQDPRGGRGNRNKKNKNRRRQYRRHNRYRAYKRKFHNERNYYYLKKIIDPDSGMVQDVATLDDIMTLDAAAEDLPKNRRKRNQNDDDSCSDDND